MLHVAGIDDDFDEHATHADADALPASLDVRSARSQSDAVVVVDPELVARAPTRPPPPQAEWEMQRLSSAFQSGSRSPFLRQLVRLGPTVLAFLLWISWMVLSLAVSPSESNPAPPKEIDSKSAAAPIL